MNHHTTIGHTLIELMLALAIAVILTCIVYPSYISYKTHSNRAMAEVSLVTLAAHLESYFVAHNTYKNATRDILGVAALERNLTYQLILTKLTDTDFIIQAMPVGLQASRDKQCGTLSMTNTDEKSISGNGNPNTCWR